MSTALVQTPPRHPCGGSGAGLVSSHLHRGGGGGQGAPGVTVAEGRPSWGWPSVRFTTCWASGDSVQTQFASRVCGQLKCGQLKRRLLQKVTGFNATKAGCPRVRCCPARGELRRSCGHSPSGCVPDAVPTPCPSSLLTPTP